jgi:ankyrin repeat protein
MKHLLHTTIAAVLLVGCGKPQDSPDPEVQPIEPVAEASQSQPPPVKFEAPDVSIQDAIKEGDIQAVMQHLAAGTDVNAKDERGETAMFSAVIGGYNEIIKMLVNKGADVGVKNKAGFTPLHEGAYNGRKEIVELLISSGADVNAMKIDGMTPLDMAAFGNHNEIAALLRKHGGKTKKELKSEGK